MENRFQQTTISFRGFAPTSSDSSLSQVNQVPSSERNVFHPAPFLGRLHDWKLPHAFGISNQYFVLYTISSYVKHENLKINMKQCNALQVAEIGRLPILVSISSVLLFFDDAQRFGAWLPWWTNRFATSLESFWRRSDLKTTVGLSVF